MATFRPDILTVTDLAAWHAEAQEAGKRMLGKGKRWRAIADRLAPYLPAGTAPAPELLVTMLGRLVATQGAASSLYHQATAVGGLHLPPGWLPTAPDAEERLAAARKATEASRALLAHRPRIWATLDRGLTEEHATLLDRLAAAWDAWLGVLAYTSR